MPGAWGGWLRSKLAKAEAIYDFQDQILEDLDNYEFYIVVQGAEDVLLAIEERKLRWTDTLCTM